MATDPRHEILFEPVRIGPKTAPNRFYQVPHASGFGTNQPRMHAAFRAMKAEGGWGTVCNEYSPVSPDSDETDAVGSDVWELDDMRRAALVADAVHEHGSLAGIELYHGGMYARNGQSRLPRLAPSQARSDSYYGSGTKTMTIADIRRVQSDFVTAARRARDVGFDIVYVYGAHGYLMTQFLSPATNGRTDAYGGSLENRARFQRETLEQVRDAIGGDCTIAVRTAIAPGDELVGLDADEMLEVVAYLDPLVDLWDVNVGGWPQDSGTSRYYPQGHQVALTSRVREATLKPIVAVGRYTDPDTMAALIRGGCFDLIGAARPGIADPFLPTKVREGRLDDIRECTGANTCILKEEKFNQIGCLQNATAGEELRRGWHPEKFPATSTPDVPVLVVGAGPAGLECAVVLGRRGYRAVHLVDAEADLGGKLRWTRRMPTLGDWGRVVDHRVVALSKLPDVQVVTRRHLTTQDVLDYGARIVVVATGSAWLGDGTQPYPYPRIAGSDAALTPEQIMDGQRPSAGPVVVYDADGYYVAPGIAEVLALEGREVHLVTTHAVVSPISDDTLEGDLLRQHLHSLGIHTHTGRILTRLDQDSARGETILGDPWQISCAGTVLVTSQASRDELYRDLTADLTTLRAAGIEAVLLIGDAAAPRMPSEAVFDGHRLARELDGANPEIPLLWKRERTSL